MNTREALGKLLDALPPDFPNRAYYEEICAKEQQMKPQPSEETPALPTSGSGVKPPKYHEDTPPPAFGDNLTAVHAKLAGAASVRGMQHISDIAAHALSRAIKQLESVRVFVSSKERIHPTGLELYDEEIESLKRSLAAVSRS